MIDSGTDSLVNAGLTSSWRKFCDDSPSDFPLQKRERGKKKRTQLVNHVGIVFLVVQEI